MMRGPAASALAVRNITTNEIICEPLNIFASKKPKVLKLPFIRGVINFVESMVVGYKSLMRSAELAGLDDDQSSDNEPALSVPSEPETTTPETSQPQTPQSETFRSESSRPQNTTPESSQPEKKSGIKAFDIAMYISLIIGLGLAVLLFSVFPAFAVKALDGILPVNLGGFKSVLEGAVKLIIFVVYLSLVSLMKDIKRVFMYHGAEHKSIHCYEKGLELTVENVKAQKRVHPRCGTSFLILVMIVSIVIFSLPIFPWGNVFVRISLKLLFLPLIASISYELIKIAGRYDNIITKIISAPGNALQLITTREPGEEQIEVALAALDAVIPADKQEDKW